MPQPRGACRGYARTGRTRAPDGAAPPPPAGPCTRWRRRRRWARSGSTAAVVEVELRHRGAGDGAGQVHGQLRVARAHREVVEGDDPGQLLAVQDREAPNPVL